jgi:tetratricopeptide (TPR) repeat protein
MKWTWLPLLAIVAACGPKKPIDDLITTTDPTDDPTGDDATADGDADPGEEKKELTIEEKVNAAVGLLDDEENQENIQKAIGELEGLVRESPSEAMAHFNLGVAYHLADKKDDAKRAYQAAVNLDPTIGDAWLYQGVLQEEQGRVDSAISNYRTGIRNDPENMNVRVALIGLLRKEGRQVEAIDEAKAALKVNANSLAVYNNMGLAYLDNGDLALARFVYQKALEIGDEAKNNAYLQSNYGWVLYQKGEKGPATYRLQKAVELDPELVPALIYLSKLYMEDRNYSDTIDLLERAAKKAPENHGVQMNLGIAYRGVGRFDDAKVAYGKAIEIDPNIPDPYINLGILYGDYTKEYKESLDAFGKYVEMGGPQSAQATVYIEAIEKEQSRSERRKKAEEARKQREKDREERKRMLEEAAKNPPPPEPDPEGTDTTDGTGVDGTGTDGTGTDGTETGGDDDPWGAPPEDTPPAEDPPAEPPPVEETPAEEEPVPVEEPPVEDAGEPVDDNPWGPQ